jgi:hypothetical protein
MPPCSLGRADTDTLQQALFVADADHADSRRHNPAWAVQTSSLVHVVGVGMLLNLPSATMRLSPDARDVWQGIGEVFTRHDDLTALYLAEIEEPLRNHPHVRFIWAHAGTSMEIHRHQTKLDFLLQTVRRMLEAYPNLYIDLSWSVLRPYLLDKQGTPDPEWVQLVSRYPARFMLGSDVVGRFDSLGDFLRGFDPFLNALPEDVAQQVARDNFLAVLPGRVKAAARR